MIAISNLLVYPLLLFLLFDYSQPEKFCVIYEGKKNSKTDLKQTLYHSTQHNLIKKDSLLIDTRKKAIQIIEPILYKIVGRKNIKAQRPYKSTLIHTYWVISGTLPITHLGGTFLVVMDARNTEIIKTSHGR